MIDTSTSFFHNTMSITLSYDMFCKLSKATRDELLSTFGNSQYNTTYATKSVSFEPTKVKETMNDTAFTSASLSFGIPLVLPPSKKDTVTHPDISVSSKVRIATNYPIAKTTDIYKLADSKTIQVIIQDINNGLFLNNSKTVKWSPGSRHHPDNWYVKQVIKAVDNLQPTNSLKIDQHLHHLDRYRITAILRELRKQGIILVY